MPEIDLRAFAKAVRFRDRAVALAVAQHERAGLRPSGHHARATFDAIAEMIREDERERLAAAGRLAEPYVPDPPRVVSWDWRQPPNLADLARAVHDLSGGTVHLRQVATGSDQYAIVLSNAELDDAAAWSVYERWLIGDTRQGDDRA